MAIRVRRGSVSSVGVRLGSVNATKLVNSSSFSIGNLASINDIDTSNRNATNTNANDININENAINSNRNAMKINKNTMNTNKQQYKNK